MEFAIDLRGAAMCRAVTHSAACIVLVMHGSVDVVMHCSRHPKKRSVRTCKHGRMHWIRLVDEALTPTATVDLQADCM